MPARSRTGLTICAALKRRVAIVRCGRRSALGGTLAGTDSAATGLPDRCLKTVGMPGSETRLIDRQNFRDLCP
jgi:hypothetical protein